MAESYAKSDHVAAKKTPIKAVTRKKSAVKKITIKKSVTKKPPVTASPAASNSKAENRQTVKSVTDEISQNLSDDSKHRNAPEQHNLEILSALTESIKASHQQSNLQDLKLQHIIWRNRLIVIPSAVILIIAISSIFYVFSLLGTAMTNISVDMHKIQLSVETISTRMDSMSLDTNSVSGNIHQLNRNVTNMSKDLNALSVTVAPSMQGMRHIRPWAP